MSTFNLVRFEKAGDAYQEISDAGEVVRYLAPDGSELFKVAPLGDGSRVVAVGVSAEALGLVALEVELPIGKVDPSVRQPTPEDVEALRVSLRAALEGAEALAAQIRAALGE